jgi:hypothetical protein
LVQKFLAQKFLAQKDRVMKAHDLLRTDADDEDLLACLVGDLADEALEAAAGAAAAQLGTWVNCTPIWWCPGVSADQTASNRPPWRGFAERTLGGVARYGRRNTRNL